MKRVTDSAVIIGMVKSRLLLAGAIMSVVALVGTRVFADNASDIESFYPNGAYVTYDNTSGDYPVVTAIGSMPGTFGGKVYTSWSVFAQDSTGSLDIFTSASVLTTLTANAGATINVGDKINVAGGWGPYHQIPELSLTSVVASGDVFQTISTGNALPTPPIFNVSQITAVGTTLSNNLNIAGFYFEMDNVTITASNGLTTLPGYTTSIANETFRVADNTGSMTLFDWTTSYSAAEMLTGTPIGASFQYNVKGFASYNTGGPLEFTALNVTAVPEPSTVALVGMGVAGLFAIRRRRR